MTSEPAYSFGYFRLLPERRALLAGEQPIKLGARAFDLLVTLVRSPERVLGKGELLEAVWPRLVVEENNLNVQIGSLRKVLGAAAIATVPGRGYRFVMPVSIEGGAVNEAPAASSTMAISTPSAAAGVTARSNLRGDAPMLFGRADDIQAVIALLVDHPMVTVAGSGGIGKTRLGQAVAHRLVSSYPDGAWWIELAALNDPAFVAATVAQALGLESDGLRPVSAVVASALRGRRVLLALDNCEHLLDGVAAFLDELHALAPGVRVLITSQEALKSADEHVYRLGTLDLPAVRAGTPLAPADVATSGAGALFVARARAVDPRFQLTAANADAVAEICRCLDGIPLAIELAAARLPLLGIDGVRSRLKERFKVLTGGTRAVLRRHQTLRAALDWSHGLLGEAERVVFRRLGVFAGGFTLESAQRVADDDEIDMWDVLEHLGTLVDKSLVLAEGESTPRYRMLETTRLFALEQLAAAGETEALLRRHARAMVVLLEPYEVDTRRRNLVGADEELLRPEADNVRAALDWLAGTSAPADDVLAAELGGVGVYALASAGSVSEVFDRTVGIAARISPHTPPAIAARFWLALSTWGAIVGQPEAYDAAGRAADLYRQLGDDRRLFKALTDRIAIGARRGESARLGPCVAEARAIERPDWPTNMHTAFRWACYRWLQAEGRPDEALACALERAAIHRMAGTLIMEQANLGDAVADCDLAAGRADVAEARCRAAIERMRGHLEFEWALAHVHETLAIVCVALGKNDDAIANARAALHASKEAGVHFRLIEAIALAAARLGRLRDAARALGYVDRLYRQRGEVRWPHVQARRAQLDALLVAGLDRDERARLANEGAAGDIELAFAWTFGLEACAEESTSPA